MLCVSARYVCCLFGWSSYHMRRWQFPDQLHVRDTVMIELHHVVRMLRCSLCFCAGTGPFTPPVSVCHRLIELFSLL
jgi:hypothetical protein